MKALRIVFVHLNTNLPKHLIENIKRMRLLFPESDLHIVHNLEISLADKFDITAHRITQSKYESDFKNHQWSTDFRSGFFQSSLMRVFVLEQFHKKFPMDPILHIESDVILMPDFPFEQIAELRMPHWNSFGIDADVGALIYSPTFNDTELLVKALRKVLCSNPHSTDMTALNYVRKENPEIYKLFPSSYQDETFKSLPFIFDGAALGMWLFGEDPRNHYGSTPRFKNPRGSHLGFKKKTVFLDNKGRLLLKEGSVLSQVVSIHLHCKDIRLFDFNNYLFRLRVRSSSKRVNMPLFSLKIFFSLARDAIRENQLKSFVYHFPFFGGFLRIVWAKAKGVKKYSWLSKLKSLNQDVDA